MDRRGRVKIDDQPSATIHQLRRNLSREMCQLETKMNHSNISSNVFIVIIWNAGAVHGNGHVRMFRNPAATRKKEAEESPAFLPQPQLIRIERQHPTQHVSAGSWKRWRERRRARKRVQSPQRSTPPPREPRERIRFRQAGPQTQPTQY